MIKSDMKESVKESAKRQACRQLDDSWNKIWGHVQYQCKNAEDGAKPCLRVGLAIDIKSEDEGAKVLPVATYGVREVDHGIGEMVDDHPSLPGMERRKAVADDPPPSTPKGGQSKAKK